MTVDTPHKRSKRPVMHSNTLCVRLQPQLCDAIIDAAVARGMNASAWMRHAAMTVAMLEGALFPDVLADGRRRYARIEGGAIVDVQYLTDAPQPLPDRTGIAPMGNSDTSRDAGTLYDRVEGRQRWARIKDGEIAGLYYHAEKPETPGFVWVPVVHEDSEPFDIAAHWRLAPLYALVDVDGKPDRVIVTFPVVPKSLEHA